MIRERGGEVNCETVAGPQRVLPAELSRGKVLIISSVPPPIIITFTSR